MKTTGNPPEWATELFVQVCKDYNRGLPSLFKWYNCNRMYSTGVTRSSWYKRHVRLKNGKLKTVQWYGEVSVRAGSSEENAKLVLLHELAHHIVGRSKTGRGQGHTMKFWKLAFELYERYGMNMEYAYSKEKGYKAKATPAYEAHIAKMQVA